MQNKKCKNCNQNISRSSKYCRKCYQLGSRNHVFGKHSWNYKGSLNYCCQDCGGLISRPTAFKGNGRCRSCSRSGKLSWNTSKQGTLHHNWKGGLPKCLDCGQLLSFYTCKRCIKCNAKIKGLVGSANPMYGKKPKFYRYLYKNITMRSSWEVLLAVWFDFSNVEWEYEPKIFQLNDKHYTPDFYLSEFDCYIEVKGHWCKVYYCF